MENCTAPMNWGKQMRQMRKILRASDIWGSLDTSPFVSDAISVSVMSPEVSDWWSAPSMAPRALWWSVEKPERCVRWSVAGWSGSLSFVPLKPFSADTISSVPATASAKPWMTSAMWGYTGPRTTWPNKMNLVSIYILLQAQDQSLNLLTCSPACYHCDMAAPYRLTSLYVSISQQVELVSTSSQQQQQQQQQ